MLTTCGICVAAESAAENLGTHRIDKDKLSFGNTQEPSLHPVKLHLPDQPKSGLPSILTQSLQPETPEHLQGDQDRALSTIYSGLSYSGRSSGDRAGLMGAVASNSPHLVVENAKQASSREQYQLVSIFLLMRLFRTLGSFITHFSAITATAVLVSSCSHLHFLSLALCMCKYCLGYLLKVHTLADRPGLTRQSTSNLT